VAQGVRLGFDIAGGWKTFSGKFRTIDQFFSLQALVPPEGISVENFSALR
jgi:hypothetical protein